VKLVDTNILIYSFDPDSLFYGWAKKVLRDAILEKHAAINTVILAELSVGDDEPKSLPFRLQKLGISITNLPWEISLDAASAHKHYLNARKKAKHDSSPKLPLPDFFIGAHAQYLSCSIITADVSHYQTYFPSVHLITPF
jgi:predicted nucleic acid-binding protein